MLENNSKTLSPENSHVRITRGLRLKQLKQLAYLVPGEVSKKERERIGKDIQYKNEILEELMGHPAPAEGKSNILPDETYLEEELEERHALVEAKKQKVRTVATNVVDFIPVIGSAKMIVEGIRGKQIGTGHEIHGVHRALHTVSGAAFLALDLTGVGAIASELGKGAFKVGERMMVKEVEKSASQKIVEKETVLLAKRGSERVVKQEKIAGLENESRKNNEAEKSDPMRFAQRVLSEKEYDNLLREIAATKQERVMNSVASRLSERRLSKKEVVAGISLAAGLAVTVPATLSLSQTSVLGILAPTLAQAVTAIQGSGVAGAVLPASTLATLSGLSGTTFGALFLTLPLMTQVALVAPPLLATLYVGSKAYRGIRNILSERAFKKHFGSSVSSVLSKK